MTPVVPDDAFPQPTCSWWRVAVALGIVAASAVVVFAAAGCRAEPRPRPVYVTPGPAATPGAHGSVDGADCPGGKCEVPNPKRR